MKIRQIEVFLAVAETGGVRRAANRLCITQSAVAKAISQLEAELGCPLFDRSALGLRPVSYTHLTLPTILLV